MKWLLQDAGENGRKHEEWAHPITVFALHYGVIIVAAFWCHDYLIDGHECNSSSRERQRDVALWTGSYAVLQLLCRIWTTNIHRNCVLYEGTWLCNTTLVVGSIALWYGRPTMTAAFCVTVGIDQLLWYVDLLGCALAGKFVVGVAKYVTWPTTAWATRLTCTHHLWTLPVFLIYARAPLTVSALALSSGLMVLHVVLSRLMTPFMVQRKYLNVNLAHELWKDIQIGILQINHDNPSACLYVFRLLWRWLGFNILVYCLLLWLQRLYFGPLSKVC